MPIDPSLALGHEMPETASSWDTDDVILYHLGIGAGAPPTDPGELSYTYEADLKVLPSFGVIPSQAALPAVMTAVWQSSAGRLMLLFVNADMQAHAFRYRFDPAALGRKPGPGGWLVSRIEPDVALPVDVQPASGIDRTERLAPFELRVLSIAPADTPAKMLVGAQHAVPLPP